MLHAPYSIILVGSLLLGVGSWKLEVWQRKRTELLHFLLPLPAASIL